MKRFLLMFAVLTTKICEGQLPTSDTLCFPVPVIQKLLIAGEQKKVLEQQVVILNERIANYQTIIASLNSIDSLTVATYTAQIKVYKDEKAIYEDQLKGYERLLKKEKRKRFFTGVGGAIITGIVGYLYLKK